MSKAEGGHPKYVISHGDDVNCIRFSLSADRGDRATFNFRD